MAANRWRLKSQREKFVKNHPEYLEVVIASKDSRKSEASNDLLDCVDLAREEIDYSDVTGFGDIVKGLYRSYKNIY